MVNNQNMPCGCLTNESARQELIKNCNSSINISYCCCGALTTEPSQITARATLKEVGKDFIMLSVKAVTIPQYIALIPISKIANFSERPPHEQFSCSCETNRMFNQAIADLCSQQITVEACFCDIPVLHAEINGTLVEVGTDFIELRNPVLIKGNTPLATIRPTNDLIISLSSICHIQFPAKSV